MSSRFAWFYLSFNGRISRQEFWLGYLLAVVAAWLLVSLLQTMSVSVGRPMGRAWYRDELDLALRLPVVVSAVVVAWPMLAILVKRLHDLGLSAWWLVYGCAMLCVATAIGMNYVGLALLSLIGFAPGMRGDNRFGGDPLVMATGRQV